MFSKKARKKMSVLIKGMEMPKNCNECKLRNGIGKDCGKAIFHCAPLAEWVMPNPLGRANDCPLVEIPPHGRLIDADALEADTEWDDREDGYISYSKVAIECAPTIIEAEESNND